MPGLVGAFSDSEVLLSRLRVAFSVSAVVAVYLGRSVAQSDATAAILEDE
jgi:hypothetical protein